MCLSLPRLYLLCFYLFIFLFLCYFILFYSILLYFILLYIYILNSTISHRCSRRLGSDNNHNSNHHHLTPCRESSIARAMLAREGHRFFFLNHRVWREGNKHSMFTTTFPPLSRTLHTPPPPCPFSFLTFFRFFLFFFFLFISVHRVRSCNVHTNTNKHMHKKSLSSLPSCFIFIYSVMIFDKEKMQTAGEWSW